MSFPGSVTSTVNTVSYTVETVGGASGDTLYINNFPVAPDDYFGSLLTELPQADYLAAFEDFVKACAAIMISNHAGATDATINRTYVGGAYEPAPTNIPYP
jgi:hypothetical protein